MNRNWLSRISLCWHNIIGVSASIVSFVYFFALKHPFEIVLWVIYIVDFLLFIASAYRLIDSFDLTKTKTIVFTIVTMIVFLIFCEVVVFVFTNGTSIEYTITLFFNVLRVSLFLSPSLILLIPVIVFIAEVMS